jgi:ABC-type sugar transport system ATPase subunit
MRGRVDRTIIMSSDLEAQRTLQTRPGVAEVEFLAADDAFSMALSREWAQRLAGYGGRAAIMGVRPEDIDIAADGSLPLGGGAVRVKLAVVDPLGSEAFLSARVGAKELTARVPPRGLPSAGNEVELVFNRERLHFFDAESGETLRE